ncbi:MAG: saccharopine dehydrogenase NADP-binding domain-containing protein, partial [Planctomycetota bacterium]
MLTFSKRILFVGFGFVARCTLPVLLKHVKVPLGNITIVEFEPDEEALRPWIEKGVNFVRARVAPDNLGELLSRHVSAGDILIDLAWNIECGEILQWCHDHGVLYLNTSVELWDPYANAQGAHPTKMTLYWRHMNLRRLVAGWDSPGPTAVLEHGANPGLISHFTKHALLDIAKACLEERKFAGAQAER